MVNISYGGRHSTNLIDDVISPAVLKRAAEDRTGLNNFRPFEQLGSNLRQAYANRGNSTRNISVRQVSSITPVNVTWVHRNLANFTYIPPVSSFASIGYANNDSALSESLKSYFDTINHNINRAVSKVTLLISVYIISPVIAFGSKTKTLLLGRDYKIGQTTKSFNGITLPTFVKTSLVVAAIGVSSLLFIRGVNDSGVAPSTTKGSKGTTTIRNDSNRKPIPDQATTPSINTPSSKQNAGETLRTGTQAPGTSWDVTPSSPESSTSPSTSGIPTTVSPSMTTTPTTDQSPKPTSTLPTLPTVTPPPIVPTSPVIINDPILTQPQLP